MGERHGRGVRDGEGNGKGGNHSAQLCTLACTVVNTSLHTMQAGMCTQVCTHTCVINGVQCVHSVKKPNNKPRGVPEAIESMQQRETVCRAKSPKGGVSSRGGKGGVNREAKSNGLQAG